MVGVISMSILNLSLGYSSMITLRLRMSIDCCFFRLFSQMRFYYFVKFSGFYWCCLIVIWAFSNGLLLWLFCVKWVFEYLFKLLVKCLLTPYRVMLKDGFSEAFTRIFDGSKRSNLMFVDFVIWRGGWLEWKSVVKSYWNISVRQDASFWVKRTKIWGAFSIVDFVRTLWLSRRWGYGNYSSDSVRVLFLRLHTTNWKLCNQFCALNNSAKCKFLGTLAFVGIP